MACGKNEKNDKDDKKGKGKGSFPMNKGKKASKKV
jgi:hypothetical protein